MNGIFKTNMNYTIQYLDLERFSSDVNTLSSKMTAEEESEETIHRMNFVKYRLDPELYKRNIVKINHSAMELVCASHLIHYDYSVDVEKQLTDILVCDLYATKGDRASDTLKLKLGLYLLNMPWIHCHIILPELQVKLLAIVNLPTNLF